MTDRTHPDSGRIITSGAAIQRYKIGYHADEWGQRSSTPSGIPDASGSWVRYADHVTALAAGQATAAQQEAAYAALPDEGEMLKHALWLASSFTVHRYLMSNAEGRWSGAEKAACHDELCCLYVAVFRGVEVDQVRVDLEADWMAVHDATQELTDHMDVVIGFPLKGVPDYDALAPKFFDHFHRLATHALRASHGQAPAGAGEPTEQQILEAAFSPAQPAAQQGAAYAALPEKYYLAGGEVPTWDATQMHAFADATHALRASHGQAPSQAGEYPALVCDYCGALTPDPWHSSGMLHGKMSKHIHSCDACAARGAAQAQAAKQQEQLI